MSRSAVYVEALLSSREYDSISTDDTQRGSESSMDWALQAVGLSYIGATVMEALGSNYGVYQSDGDGCVCRCMSLCWSRCEVATVQGCDGETVIDGALLRYARQ